MSVSTCYLLCAMLRAAIGMLLLASCARSEPARQLDLDAVRITGDARLRTDTVGDGKFAGTASFVLVDAENTAGEGAYVTLGGALTGTAGVVGQLKSQSLWIPAHEVRTFALVDSARVPRPAAISAQIKVYGAVVREAPRAAVSELHRFDDGGKTVVQAYVDNTADRLGQIMVIASFHDAGGQPMTRPFQMIELNGKARRSVQFVGPPGSKTGTVYIGDAIY